MFVLNALKSIKHFVFDVDGVMTNSDMLITEEGALLRTVSTRDGQGIRFAIDAGYDVCIITGGRSKGVEKRFLDLGAKEVRLGVSKKLPILQEYVEKYTWNPSHMLYMGDDIPDIPCMQFCKIGACPQDAVDEVKHVSQYISPFQGGRGCVRDIIEKVMKMQDKWPVN